MILSFSRPLIASLEKGTCPGKLRSAGRSHPTGKVKLAPAAEGGKKGGQGKHNLRTNEQGGTTRHLILNP